MFEGLVVGDHGRDGNQLYNYSLQVILFEKGRMEILKDKLAEE
jgi:hypothetical protein